MSYGVRILCRPEVAAGFMLAGVPVVEAVSVERALEEFRSLLEDMTVGVVLMEESFHDRLPEDLRRRLGRKPLPMVVPFPGPAWGERPEAAESYIVELLRQVIGYRVRLR
jgi:vacuolar-type H+-ATPase subunit F/Vma7